MQKTIDNEFYIAYIFIISRKGEKEIKTVEDIRKEQNVNQTIWAQMIGTTYRTYQGRLTGDQPKWLLMEIIEASSYNNGEVKVSTYKGDYEITIKKV